MQNNKMGVDSVPGKSSLKKNPFFEWFYFDVHCADSVDVVFTFHSRPFMSGFKVSILDIFIYKYNRPYYHTFLVFPFRQIEFRDDRRRMEYGGKQNFLLQYDENAAILEAKSGQVELTMRFENIHPQKHPLEFCLGDLPFWWKLWMPLAKGKGRLRFWNSSRNEYEEITVNGRAYFDSNFGSINVKKTLSSWLWFKIYKGEELWIAGDVRPLKGPARKILVQVQPQEIRYTTDLSIEFTSRTLSIQSSLGRFHATLTESVRLDDLYFLVPVWPAALAPLEKIREIMAAFTLDKSGLKWARKWLTNGTYRRHRWLAQTSEDGKVEIFGEEMVLNE